METKNIQVKKCIINPFITEYKFLVFTFIHKFFLVFNKIKNYK